MGRLLCLALVLPNLVSARARPRARELGVAPGIFAPGPRNAITAVAGCDGTAGSARR